MLKNVYSPNFVELPLCVLPEYFPRNFVEV